LRNGVVCSTFVPTMSRGTYGSPRVWPSCASAPASASAVEFGRRPPVCGAAAWSSRRLGCHGEAVIVSVHLTGASGKQGSHQSRSPRLVAPRVLSGVVGGSPCGNTGASGRCSGSGCCRRNSAIKRSRHGPRVRRLEVRMAPTRARKDDFRFAPTYGISPIAAVRIALVLMLASRKCSPPELTAR
jgi:hypothetical protein